MVKITIVPNGNENIYGMMVEKEYELRLQNQGTLHRVGRKTKNREKWAHKSFKGWVRFERCPGGIVVAILRAKDPKDEWQLLTSFVGFLDRHLREYLSSVGLSYEGNGD